jgi:osmotically-inducible protein OsmY
MLPVQNPKIYSDELSRCEEQAQSTDHEKNISPTQKTDVIIKDRINTALWKDDVLRATEYDQVDVRVKNGVVHLSGHIVNTTSQSRIENAIQDIPGVLKIRNNLVLDEKLTSDVAASLSELEHTHACKFFTGTSHGVVSLGGLVSNDKVKLMAEKRAAGNPNVRGVINNIRTSRVGQKLKNQPFLQPLIGELIYFLDGISGVVKHVIINPDNRRVISMIIQGDFIDSRYKVDSLADGKVRLPEQLIIVPVSTVRYLTKVSGFLYISSSERKQYMDFDPGCFFTPNSDWVPPYPYCPVDVLFPIEYQNADAQIVSEPDPFPFGEILEEASVREQFFATDSLGL